MHFFKRIQTILYCVFLVVCVFLGFVPTPRTNYHLDLNPVYSWDTVKFIKDINIMILFLQNLLYSRHVVFDESVFPFSLQDALVPMKSTNNTTDPLTLQVPLSPTIPSSPNNFLSKPSRPVPFPDHFESDQSLTSPVAELPVSLTPS